MGTVVMGEEYVGKRVRMIEVLGMRKRGGQKR